MCDATAKLCLVVPVQLLSSKICTLQNPIYTFFHCYHYGVGKAKLDLISVLLSPNVNVNYLFNVPFIYQ